MRRPPYIEKIHKRLDVDIDTSSYPFNIPIIKNFKEIQFKNPVTFIIGENGTGKSTLLESFAVALGFNAEGGSLNFNFRTKETHSDLHNYLKIIRSYNRNKDGYFLRAESFYNVITEIDNLDEIFPFANSTYGGNSLHNCSHGESFMILFNNRFNGNGLYILDEPEAAFSPSRQMSILVRMNELVKLGAQFIIATHSPILLAFPNADIYEINGEKLVHVKYENTEHYAITKYFLNNTQIMLEELFKND